MSLKTTMMAPSHLKLHTRVQMEQAVVVRDMSYSALCPLEDIFLVCKQSLDWEIV